MRLSELPDVLLQFYKLSTSVRENAQDLGFHLFPQRPDAGLSWEGHGVARERHCI